MTKKYLVMVSTIGLIAIASYTLMSRRISKFSMPTFSLRFQEKRNTTLVVLMGTLRCGEAAWNSLYSNLLDPNSADLALLVPRSSSRSATLYERSKYIWEHEEYDDWGEAIDEYIVGSNATGWRHIANNTQTFGIFGGTKVSPRGSGAITLLSRVFLQERIKSLGLVEKYDRFVVTRSDQYYLCPIDLGHLDNRFLWVPQGEDYNGICDRYLVSNNTHILDALNILPPVVVNPLRYWDLSNRDNVEKLLKRRWIEDGLWNDVKRFPRVMFTCAALGDISRWRRPMLSNEVFKGVYLKYEGEYNASLKTCGDYLSTSVAISSSGSNNFTVV
jgi:hypothetical protein